MGSFRAFRLVYRAEVVARALRSPSVGLARAESYHWEAQMNNIIYVIGLIVVVLAILGFLGLR